MRDTSDSVGAPSPWRPAAASRRAENEAAGPAGVTGPAAPALMPHNFAQPVRLIPLGRVQVFRLRGFGRAEDPQASGLETGPAV